MKTHGRDMLVAAPERWDEACFAVPAVRSIRASGLSVGVICREEQREFWQTLPDVEVIGFSQNTKAKQLAVQLGADWQASLVWETGMVADAVGLARVPRRLGPDDKKLKRQLTYSLGFSMGPLEHRVRYYLSAVEEMGIQTSKPEFFAPASVGIAPENGTVLLSPDSDFGPSHEWSLEGWLETAKNLIEKKVGVTVAGIGGGRGLGETLAAKLGDTAKFFQATPLAGALPRLAEYSLCVSADGSLPHLAAHVGATCVTLFGPNDPAWKRPLGRRHAVVRRHVECAPCLLAKCPLDQRCQNELTIDRVWSAVLEKLG